MTNPVDLLTSLFSFITAILGFAAAGVISKDHIPSYNRRYTYVNTQCVAACAISGVVFFATFMVYTFLAFKNDWKALMQVIVAVCQAAMFALVIAAGATTGQ